MNIRWWKVGIFLFLNITTQRVEAAQLQSIDCPRINVREIEVVPAEFDTDVFQHISFYKKFSEQVISDRIEIEKDKNFVPFNEVNSLFQIVILETDIQSYSPVRALPGATSDTYGIELLCSNEGVLFVDDLVQTFRQQTGGPFIYKIKAKIELKDSDAIIGVKFYLLHTMGNWWKEKLSIEAIRKSTPTLVGHRTIRNN